jgi:hypothetical protein
LSQSPPTIGGPPHAALGHEVALEVLRSKKLKPGFSVDDSNEKYQDALGATKLSKERQAAVLSAQGINQKHQRALLAVIKMQKLISKESGLKNDNIKFRIDTKGTVIFSLKTGGTIRDTGPELRISPNDPNAKTLAGQYARMKWGQKIIETGNLFKFDNQRGKGKSPGR